MPLQLRDRVAVLTGAVTVEDAEPLAQWLRRPGPARSVNLRDCTHLHTAVLQLLLATGVRVSAPPTDPFLAGLPALAPADTSAQPAPSTASEKP